MYCPVCKSEYRDEFEICTDCNVNLVEKLENTNNEDAQPINSFLRLFVNKIFNFSSIGRILINCGIIWALLSPFLLLVTLVFLKNRYIITFEGHFLIVGILSELLRSATRFGIIGSLIGVAIVIFGIAVTDGIAGTLFGIAGYFCYRITKSKKIYIAFTVIFYLAYWFLIVGRIK